MHRMLSCGESGPKYYFKGYVSDELSLIARTRNKNNEWEKQLEDFCIGGNLDIRLDVDKDFYFVFDIDLSYFNSKLMLKYYANAIFGYLDGMGGEIFCKFLSNFDFVYSYNIKVLVDKIISDRHVLLNLKKLSCEERKEKLLLKEGSCSTKLSLERAYACLEWIDKISEQDSRYEKYIEEIEESEGLEEILIFMFLISRQEIFKLLLAHVLSSEPNFKKSLLAEVLFQLNAIDEDTMENLLQRKNLLNLQSWKEKIDDEFLAPLLRLTNMLPFHSTLIRYLFVILFAEMNSLEKDCKEVKDFLSTCHSDYEKLSVGFLKSLELLQPDHPLVKNFSVTSSGKFSLLHKIILLTSSDYELSFTNYVYQRLSVQCKEIMNFYVNPTRRIKRKEKEQIAALYEKMKLIVAKSLDETS